MTDINKVQKKAKEHAERVYNCALEKLQKDRIKFIKNKNTKEG